MQSICMFHICTPEMGQSSYTYTFIYIEAVNFALINAHIHLLVCLLNYLRIHYGTPLQSIYAQVQRHTEFVSYNILFACRI